MPSFDAPVARGALFPYRHPADSDAAPLFATSKSTLRMGLCALLAGFDLGLIVIVAAIVDPSNAAPVGAVTALTMLTYAAIASRRELWSPIAIAFPREYADRATVAICAAAILAFALTAFFGRLAWLAPAFAWQMVLTAACVCFGRPRLVRLMRRWFPGAYSNDVILRHGPATIEAPGSLIVTPEEIAIHPDPSDPHMLNRIGNLFRNCDRVVLDTPVNRRALWIEALSGIDVDIEVVASEHEHHRPLELRWLNGHFTLLMRQGALRPWFRAQKRAFDLVIGVPLLLMLMPLMTAIAVLIKLETKGPVLFRQRRVGCGNRQFEIYKFRTMRHGMLDSLGARSTTPADERMTRIGRILRRTSLDELPQLLNVLSGEMSLVGPRPHALGSRAGEALFWDVDRRYWERHAIKPGMTGLAQVRGLRGATHSAADVADRVQADIEYIETWSLLNDFAILLKTARVLIHSKAY